MAFGLLLLAPAALFLLANILNELGVGLLYAMWNRLPNMALILTVGLMLAAFVAYAFVENFSLLSTHAS